MGKKNCWEFMGCKKELCAAHSEKRLNGIHGGINAGRACWVVAGTRCGGQVQGDYAQKIGNCMKCDFYLDVAKEEGAPNLKNGAVLLDILQGSN
jgi:hypothetical protein